MGSMVRLADYGLGRFDHEGKGNFGEFELTNERERGNRDRNTACRTATARGADEGGDRIRRWQPALIPIVQNSDSEGIPKLV